MRRHDSQQILIYFDLKIKFPKSRHDEKPQRVFQARYTSNILLIQKD